MRAAARRASSQGFLHAAAWGQAPFFLTIARRSRLAVRLIETTSVPEGIVVVVRGLGGALHPIVVHVVAIIARVVLGGVLSAGVSVSRWSDAVRRASATASPDGGP